MDPERSTASTIGRWVGWLAVLALTLAVGVGTMTVVGQVTERPLTRAATPSAVPSAAGASATTAVQLLGLPTLPDVLGRPVAEAQPALEGVGASVLLVDARDGDRPVGTDWVVCAAGPPTSWGSPADMVQVDALPAGEPCP